jgi:NADH dehydrogenase FAD-containing subunit
VDRREEHEFVPLIHEVAVGRVHPESVRFPNAPTAKPTYGFLRAEATGVDLENKTVRTSSRDIRYRYLVLAPAASPPNPRTASWSTSRPSGA